MNQTESQKKNCQLSGSNEEEEKKTKRRKIIRHIEKQAEQSKKN